MPFDACKRMWPIATGVNNILSQRFGCEWLIDCVTLSTLNICNFLTTNKNHVLDRFLLFSSPNFIREFDRSRKQWYANKTLIDQNFSNSKFERRLEINRDVLDLSVQTFLPCSYSFAQIFLLPHICRRSPTGKLYFSFCSSRELKKGRKMSSAKHKKKNW